MTSHISKPKSAYVDDVEYEEQLDELLGNKRVEQTIENLEARGFNVMLVSDGQAALEGQLWPSRDEPCRREHTPETTEGAQINAAA